MSIAYVNSAVLSAVASPTLSGASIAVSAGNLLVVGVNTGVNTANEVTGITDDAGNTFTKVRRDTATNLGVEVWYAWNCLGDAGNNIQVSVSVSSTTIRMIQAQFSGAKTLSDPLLDHDAVTISSGTSLTTGSLVLSSSGAVICYGTTYQSRSWTPGADYTEHYDSGSYYMTMSRTSLGAGSYTADAAISSVTPATLVALAFADDSVPSGSLYLPRPRSKHLLIR